MPRRPSRFVPEAIRAAAPSARRALLAAAFAAFALAAWAPEARAQRRMTKEYPAAPNVRLFLNNRSGSVTVEAWAKNRVKVTASMESGSTRVVPQVSGEGVTIDVERENREDTGDVNFIVQVPHESTVDIQTKMGNITVRNVRGSIVRARVSTEGDIELTGIRAHTVMAENIRGNILFDAELLNGGSYMLKSVEGDIQLRVTADAGFRLTAVAPRTRSIDLGGFAGRGQFEFFNDRRKVVGKVGDGGASLNMTNGRGTIVFMQR